MLNVVFLLIYVVASGFFSGVELLILLTIHFSILTYIHLREKQLLITPIFLFTIGVIIVNIANLDLITQVAERNIKTYSYIVPRYIDQAALIWCISSTMCVIGYNLAARKSLPRINFDLDKKSVLEYLFWILLIANALTIIGYGASMKGNQIAKIFGLINTIGILFYARIWAKTDSKTYRSYAIALFVIETYVAMVTAFLRFELVVPAFYLALGYFIGKGNIRYLLSYRALPFVFMIMLYSSVFSKLQQNRSNFISVFNGDETEQVEQVSDTKAKGGILDRSANLAQLTNVVNLTEKNGFYDGMASAPILTALIPRVLWPEKPLIQLGAWFALEIGVASRIQGRGVNNSVNMTVAGELYLDFGWIGVVLGSLLFGAFLAILWNATLFHTSPYNLTGTTFGGYLLLLSIGSYADLQIIITLLSTYLIFLMLKKVADHYANPGYRPVMERK